MSIPVDLCHTDKESKRITALDGLRGLAILLVTLYRFAKEAFPETESGRLLTSFIKCGTTGVDLFFVLSGFLVTSVLLDAKSQPHYFSRFYFRRTLRIFPVYFSSLALFLYLLPFFLGSGLLFPQASRNQLYLWTYTSNLKCCVEGSWCFGYLDHFWSLAIEEQFYIVWPIFVYLMTTRTLFRFSLVAIAMCLIARTLYCMTFENQVAAELFTLFRCDGLLMGACIAVLRRDGYELSTTNKKASVAIGLGVLTLGIFGMLGLPTFKLQTTLVAIIWTWFLVKVLSSGRKSYLTRFLESLPMRSLGKHSYSMYVIQSPLIPLVAITGIWPVIQKGFLGGACYVLSMSLITYGFSILIWYGIEIWFLRLRK